MSGSDLVAQANAELVGHTITGASFKPVWHGTTRVGEALYLELSNNKSLLIRVNRIVKNSTLPIVKTKHNEHYTS